MAVGPSLVCLVVVTYILKEPTAFVYLLSLTSFVTLHKGAREINDDIDFFAPKTYNKHVIEVKKIGGWFPFFAAGGLRPPAILRKVVVFECPKTQRLAVRLY